MELIYVCRICGRENKIDAETLLASRELICSACRHRSSLIGEGEAPKRWDASLNPEQERAACYHDAAKAVLVLAGRDAAKQKRSSPARSICIGRCTFLPNGSSC